MKDDWASPLKRMRLPYYFHPKAPYKVSAAMTKKLLYLERKQLQP